jgi:hypothetical protein
LPCSQQRRLRQNHAPHLSLLSQLRDAHDAEYVLIYWRPPIRANKEQFGQSSLTVGQDDSNFDIVVFASVECSKSRSRVRDIDHTMPKPVSNVFMFKQVNYSAELGDRRQLWAEYLQLAIGFSGGKLHGSVPNQLPTLCEQEHDYRDDSRNQPHANSRKYEKFEGP